MITDLRTLPIDKRISLVEDIWDSIANDNAVLPLTEEQREHLDHRLNAYELDGVKGRVASDAIADIRKKL